MKKYKTGGMTNPNAKVAVQKVAGSKGVGTTKSAKLNAATSKATGRTGGGNKSVAVEPKGKKK